MQELPGMGHPNPISTGVLIDRKIDSLGTGHQSISSFNKNKDKQAGIPHWKYQSRRTHHPATNVLNELTTPSSKKTKEVGPTTSPVL